ncbi:hypothetical protein ACJJTC_019241, partial [Scirpophaga incertulas]
MSRLDLVVFGATGFTGQHAVKHLAEKEGQFSKLTWGIAGRSKSKLEDLLKDVSQRSDLSGVRVIVADVSDDEALRAMCAQGARGGELLRPVPAARRARGARRHPRAHALRR